LYKLIYYIMERDAG